MKMNRKGKKSSNYYKRNICKVKAIPLFHRYHVSWYLFCIVWNYSQLYFGYTIHVNIHTRYDVD